MPGGDTTSRGRDASLVGISYNASQMTARIQKMKTSRQITLVKSVHSRGILQNPILFRLGWSQKSNASSLKTMQ